MYWVAVEANGQSPRRLRIAFSPPTSAIDIGASIAIDGVCLTVVAKAKDSLSFEAATETLERTTLGQLAEGAQVNLERALRLGDHLGGHLVAGHVDDIGCISSREQRQSALYLGIKAPNNVAVLTAARGSITVSGVSLTVTEVQEDVFYVAGSPYLSATTLGCRRWVTKSTSKPI
ncbi:MAG: riboflavin synthase [Myxococcota bacterium]